MRSYLFEEYQSDGLSCEECGCSVCSMSSELDYAYKHLRHLSALQR